MSDEPEMGEYATGGSAGKWISGAIKHKGALRTAAHRAGESTKEFARAHQHSPGVLGKRARLAITLSKFHHG